MARAVKKGGCRLYTPLPSEDERPHFVEGEPTLNMVGYVPAEKTVELACAILDDTHVHGWEIMQAFALMETAQTPDGDPIEHVRIVFADDAVARRERRPMLDGGLQVFAYDPSGELRPIDD